MTSAQIATVLPRRLAMQLWEAYHRFDEGAREGNLNRVVAIDEVAARLRAAHPEFFREESEDESPT